MTHGRSARNGLEFTDEKAGAHLTGSSEEPTKQATEPLASLEVRVAALEKEVAALWEVINPPDDIGPNYFYTGINDNKDNKPGPGKNIEDADLFRSRNGLVGWLEDVWPEIVHPLLAAANPREVAAVLKKAARPKDLQPPWQSRFLRHPAYLFDFLHSRRFRRKPPKQTSIDALNRPADDERRKRAANHLPTRQIANAMAGVPKLSWRTSLDRCSKNPCPYPIAPNTDRHYRAIFATSVPKSK